MAAQAQSQVAVNLHLTGATLKEVVTEIRKQAHVDIVYSNEDIRQLAPKNYNMEKASIGEVIDYALGGSNLTYEIKNGVIVIRQKSGDYITGRVVDNTGEPIPGGRCCSPALRTAPQPMKTASSACGQTSPTPKSRCASSA